MNKPKIEKDEIDSYDTVLTKENLDVEDYDFEKSELIKFVNKEIANLKEPYKHLSVKHDELLRLPSNSKIEINPNKPTRYEILRSSLSKLCGSKEGFPEDDVHEEIKLLRDMHNGIIKRYIAKASIMLTDFPEWRFIQIPINSSSNGLIYEQHLRETLLAADLVKENLGQNKNEKRKLKFIRILSCDVNQKLQELVFLLNIPGISNHDISKIQFNRTERSLLFSVKNCKGVDYIFEKKSLASEIDPKNSEYYVTEMDCVFVVLMKKKEGIWPYVDNFSRRTKEIWELEMKNVLKDLIYSPQDHLLATENIWKVAVIMKNGGTDFLNLPADLNHVKRTFKSLDDMISYYVAFISVVPQFKALVIILGGAIYEKLILSTGNQNKLKYKLTLTVQNKKTSKYVTEITKIMKAAVMKIIGGLNLYHCDKFEEAFEEFCTAIDMFPHYKFFYYRSFCLLSMKRYEEAYSDSIKALRVLGPIKGFDCMLNCLHFEIEQLHLIRALDLSYSLPFVVEEEIPEYHKTELILLRKKAFNRLNLLISFCKLISRKNYELSLLFLEQFANTGDRFKTALGLSYIIVQKHEKAHKIASLITNKKKFELAWYILGMSAYYMIDIDKAITWLNVISEKNKVSIKFLITKLERVKFLIDEGDQCVQFGNLSKAIDSYIKILECDRQNVRLRSLIWLWIGNLKLSVKDYSGAIESFSSSISLNGDSFEALRLKDVAIKKLEI